MSKRKVTIGILLIILSFSTIFLSIIPSLYANNKSGKIEKELTVDFAFLEEEDSDFLLLYFGYVGCTTICPPALNQISKIYEKIDKKKFSFYFVNLQENTPKNNVKLFVEVFNKNFKGIYLNNKEIKKVVNTLNVKFMPSLTDKNEIEHSGFLHVLKKNKNGEYKQLFFYTTKPFQEEEIIKDLNKL